MIIDFHTHIFPPRLKAERERLARDDPHFASMYSSPKAKMATAEALIAAMDVAEIERSVVLGFCWATPRLCYEHNSYILESIARYPDRLSGFCVVQTSPLEGAIKEIERCAAAGIKGVGEMRPDLPLFDFTSEDAAPLVEAVIKHRLILLTHTSEPVGHIYPGKGLVTPQILYPFIARNPGLTIVCAHWGGGLPFYALMPEVTKAFKNVYFDIAASPFLYSQQVYRQVMDIVGSDKILFGTDYPLMPQSRVVDEIKGLGLPDDEVDLILSGNAKRLLG